MNYYERVRAKRKEYNHSPKGKYIVETQNASLHSWGYSGFRFNNIEDAKRYINDRQPNEYGNLDLARIIHLEVVDEHTVKTVIDWLEER